MLIERVTAFVQGGSDDDFEELASAVFAYQYESTEAFRALCERRGVTPGKISDWREVPAMPVPAAASSESTGDTEVDNQRYDGLRRAVIDNSFPPACLEGMGRPAVLSLIPPVIPPATPPVGGSTDPGLCRLAEHLLRAWAAPASVTAMARRGVEVAKARSFLGARQRDRLPILILSTAGTLAQLLESLDRRGLRFRLPPGSRVVVSGVRGPIAAELLALLSDGLAVAPESVVADYGVSGLVSRFYAGYDRQGEPQPLRPPPWTRLRILDPRTLDEAPHGVAGSIAVFDLATLSPTAHLLTNDVGVAGDDGIRLAAGETPSTARPGSR